MAEVQDVNTLKKRGRRRLVGAIALVLVAVIVLPWIFDPEPRQAPPVSVRIPNEDESEFKPKPVPKPPLPAPKSEPPPSAVPAEPKTSAAPAAAPSEPASKSERERAEAALANARFVVPVGAFAEPEGVLAKLKAAKIPYFTEPVATEKGRVIRVRAGPYASRDAAERAMRRIKALGLEPGSVIAGS